MAQLTKKREKMVAGSLSRRNIIVNDIVLSREPQSCDALLTFESHYTLVETNSGQLGILIPYPTHPVVVVNTALMNIIKCCFFFVYSLDC